ncbi:hypothetical protein [Methanolobus vulcani]|nr:hypothetical protein [Methanolobus vulcani]
MARTASQKLPDEMYHINVRYGLHPNKLRENGIGLHGNVGTIHPLSI